MWRVARNSLPFFALVCSACSLVVDFPEKPPADRDQKDASIDAAPRVDAQVDARQPDAVVDAQADARPDTGPATSCNDDDACEPNGLCCPAAAGGGKACRPFSTQSCTECGVPCSDPKAPNCGSKVCECVAGSGRACADDQLCLNAGAQARCVQCLTDTDCGSVSGRGQCVNNQCVQCDRGAMLDSAEDDEGCSGATPICGPDNLCIGCNDANPATQCPNDLRCNPGRGCAGCVLPPTAPVRGNKCSSEMAPVCKDVDGEPQCVGCTNNPDCIFASGPGYCVETTGACSNKCDPNATVGGNGCSAATGRPFCKAAAVEGGYDCAPCEATDCTGTTPHCSMTGDTAGRCVQCLSNAHCDQSGLTPICGANNQCRARTMADCAAPTPYLSPSNTCVECTNSTHCAGNPNGAVCDSSTGTCVACARDVDCVSNATPTCDPATKQCVAGCNITICASHPGANVCVEATGACVECEQHFNCISVPGRGLCSAAFTCVDCGDWQGPGNPDSQCAMLNPSWRCAASGNCAEP